MQYIDLALQKIQLMIDILKNKSLSISQLVKKEYNYEVEVRENKDKVKILVYFGKKGLKTIFQGNEESKLFIEVKSIISSQLELNFIEKAFEEPLEYIGTDESGKGDFFGPLVIAGVFINQKIRKGLISLNVRDSKEISDNEIKFLAKKINTINGIEFSLLNIIPEQYNQLYEKHKNLNHILKYAHQKVITDILQKRKCNFVIVDKFGKDDFDLGITHSSVEVKLITKAEKFVAVAAASILARNEMVKWFDDFREKYKFELPKGANTENILSVSKEINNSDLYKFAKIHFKTTKKLH